MDEIVWFFGLLLGVILMGSSLLRSELSKGLRLWSMSVSYLASLGAWAGILYVLWHPPMPEASPSWAT